MWENQYGDTFETRDDVYLDAENMLDDEDILHWLVDNYPARTILDWMGDNAMDPIMECIDAYVNENYTEVEEMHKCPTGDWECPYYASKGSLCQMDNPMKDCDDYYAAVGDE